MSRWLHWLCWAIPLGVVAYGIWSGNAASWTAYLPLLACPLSMLLGRLLAGSGMARGAGEPLGQRGAAPDEEHPSG